MFSVPAAISKESSILQSYLLYSFEDVNKALSDPSLYASKITAMLNEEYMSAQNPATYMSDILDTFDRQLKQYELADQDVNYSKLEEFKTLLRSNLEKYRSDTTGIITDKESELLAQEIAPLTSRSHVPVTLGDVNVSKLFIANMVYDPPKLIEFCGILPDDFTESHSANFTSDDIRGRSNPVRAYKGSGARTLHVNISMHDDYFKWAGIMWSSVLSTVASLKALTYPIYSNGYVKPPQVMLSMYNFIRIKGIVTNVEVTWKKPLRDDRYVAADVVLTIEEAVSMAFDASEVGPDSTGAAHVGTRYDKYHNYWEGDTYKPVEGRSGNYRG